MNAKVLRVQIEAAEVDVRGRQAAIVKLAPVERAQATTFRSASAGEIDEVKKLLTEAAEPVAAKMSDIRGREAVLFHD